VGLGWAGRSGVVTAVAVGVMVVAVLMII